jgi:hypothetical protein
MQAGGAGRRTIVEQRVRVRTADAQLERNGNGEPVRAEQEKHDDYE